LKAKKKNTRQAYSPELKRFAITLHFLSRKGYEFVRKQFADCLPSISIISKWYSKVDGKPGFQQQAFDFLGKKQKEGNFISPIKIWYFFGVHFHELVPKMKKVGARLYYGRP
jgi:hypothetical protein